MSTRTRQVDTTGLEQRVRALMGLVRVRPSGRG
jgi:hypothetical protein